jgi:hypothetical protein
MRKISTDAPRKRCVSSVDAMAVTISTPKSGAVYIERKRSGLAAGADYKQQLFAFAPLRDVFSGACGAFSGAPCSILLYHGIVW